jgi:hypothetical protein
MRLKKCALSHLPARLSPFVHAHQALFEEDRGTLGLWRTYGIDEPHREFGSGGSVGETNVRKEASAIDKGLSLIFPLVGIVIALSAASQGQQPRAKQTFGWTAAGVVLNVILLTIVR